MRLQKACLVGLVLLLLVAIAPSRMSAAAPRMPMRIVLLVDSSATMAGMVNDFRKGLAAFVDTLPEDAEVALISTGGQLRIRVPPTADRDRLRRGIAAFASDGGANAFLDTLLESDTRFLKPATDRQPVFMMLATDMPQQSEINVDGYNRFVHDFVSRRGRAYGVVVRTNVTMMGVASEFVDNLTTNTYGAMEVIAVTNNLAERMRNFGIALQFGR